MEAVGAQVEDLRRVEDSQRPVNSRINDYHAIETTYARIRQKESERNHRPEFITETEHSLFVTGIIAGKDFLATLSERDRRALERAARAAARVERAESEMRARFNKDALLKEGTRIITLSPSVRSAFRERTESLYMGYEKAGGATFLNSILQMQ